MTYLTKEFQRLAGRAVSGYNMIQAEDHILVGLSGGKDSVALLWYLTERRSRVPIRYRMTAVHLDMGYNGPGVREELGALCAAWGVDFHYETTDYAIRAHSAENRENPCFLCARLRRRRLFELARDLDAPKVALGHHRDDLGETLLLNILFSGEISSMKPVQSFFGGRLTILRPLCMVPEETIRRLVRALELPVVESLCPSHGRTRRAGIKETIDRLAGKNGKVRGNLFRSMWNVRSEYLPEPLARGGGAAFGPVPDPSPEASWGKEVEVMTENLRKRTRVNFKTTVHLQHRGREIRDLASRDLSLKGLYLETDQSLPLDSPVDITLELTGVASDLRLRMKGVVARVDKGGMGIDFTEVDLDSFYHLRNIILYNSGDPNAVDTEMVTKPAF